MRVLGVMPLYPPFSLVGAWLSTHVLLKRLAERGHHVDVRTVYSPLNYEHEGVNVLGKLTDTDADIQGYDVVVSHHGDDEAKVADACHAAEKPHVLMVHGTPETSKPATLTVYNSESSRDGRDGIVVRPHVDPADYRTTPGDMVTLVNLSSEKGGWVLRLIARAMPDTRFLGVLGGYGRQIHSRESNVELIQSTVEMRDRVYARTRILLMPSQAETWGRVGIEAMASGIPVIAHPTPGLEESLGSAGIFVDREDIEGWVAAIRSLEDPDEYEHRSGLALRRSAALDTGDDVERFADAVEALA